MRGALIPDNEISVVSPYLNKAEKSSGKHTIDLHDIDGLPWMVGCPTYLVDMSATVTMSTGDVAVVDRRKFLRRLG